ncbi:murein L,D-transpeptidase [Paludibacter sp. 221]|uniref:L,D-transpeptidase n=1 Tax=Paludibacter sp. 221 TaxID=2302939 RepID=UPI0013D217E4|nr:L,D-transpeptidase [Paludibacter sp. 221]NDV47674.1 murein L,D-transpeptidase [Paludibacter sp. 221]
MKRNVFVLFGGLMIAMYACSYRADKLPETKENVNDTLSSGSAEKPVLLPKAADIAIEKDFIYDNLILTDSYPYRNATRQFQWDKIRDNIAYIDSIQYYPASWGVIQNRKNINGEAPLVKNHRKNNFDRIVDDYGVECYQAAPLYHILDSVIPERYGIDGTLIKYVEQGEKFSRVRGTNFDGEWLIPNKYLKPLRDVTVFTKAIFVDRANQNIATLEKVEDKWLVRSMDHATTGLEKPPLQKETPLGIFVVQEKKSKMYYFADNTTEIGGFAPFASRFCNGAYIHGIPVNLPDSTFIERSWTLGTTPRSHMCVRNATSHAKFVYSWAPVSKALVCVIE